ncbi:MAG: hypothetical protein BGO41_00600 [Clostridiales bacterium 38-18]|nr:MAG: hypothetical protein BGO41_00600 [Clostridiales bacterium 38-18]
MAKEKESLFFEERLEKAIASDWERLYNVPNNWIWTRLDSLGSFGMGQTILSKNLIERGVPVYSATEEDKIFGYIPEEENRINLGYHDLVIPARGNSIGHVKYISEESASCTQTTMYFKPYNKKVSRFLYYYMKYNKEDLFKHSGNAIPQVTISNIKVKSVPLPPLAEQERIVERIEGLFSKLDEAKGKVQIALDSFEDRKAAILHKAFTGELSKKWREENGVGVETRILKPLSAVCSSFQYGTSSKSDKEGSVAVVRMGNLQNGEIDWSDLVFSDNETDNKKYNLKIGDVLFNRTNSPALVGKTSIYRGDFPAIFAGYLIRLNYGDELIGEYLNYMMNTHQAKEYCNSVKSDGVNQSNINAKKIAAFIIPVPSIDEQTEIVRILDSIFGKEKQAEELTNAILKIDHMKKTILSRAFRGELGTNKTEEESAIEFLKEMLSGN